MKRLFVLLLLVFASFLLISCGESGNSDHQKVMNEIKVGYIEGDNAGKVTGDLILPNWSSKIEDAVIVWESDNPSIITIEEDRGLVTRPDEGDEILLLEDDFEYLTSNINYNTSPVKIGGQDWIAKELGYYAGDQNETASKMLRFRGANTAYVYSGYFNNVTKFEFDAKYYHDGHKEAVMKVSYQLSGEENWVVVETIKLTDKLVKQVVNINKDDVRIRIDVTGKSANIDNVKVYGLNIELDYEKYTVEFDTDGGNVIEPIIVKENTKLILPENPEKAGYNFVEWQLDGEAYDEDYLVIKDIILVAIWQVVDQNATLLIADFGKTDNSSGAYANEYTDAVSNGNNDETTSWTRKGGNYNVTSWDYIRLGGKAASSLSDPQVYLKTNFTFDEIVNKITINVVAAKDTIKVHLQTSIDGVTWTTLESKNVVTGDMVFDNLNVAPNTYFRIIIERGSTDKNTGLDVKTITFERLNP